MLLFLFNDGLYLAGKMFLDKTMEFGQRYDNEILEKPEKVYDTGKKKRQ